MKEKIKVLVVDDSAVVRQVVTSILSEDPAIELIGTASDPIFAMAKMDKQWPDVILLDIEMPRMDGITFLRKIMSERPTPVVICSSLTEQNSETLQRALSSGAVDIITKPKIGLKGFLHESGKQLLDAVKAAGQAKVGKQKAVLTPIKVKPKLTADAILPAGSALRGVETTEKIVAIGTSTGGTQALEMVLTQLPRVSPPIVIVQHMPEKFTEAFAQRLDSICEIRVKEACNNDRVLPGLALIAPGGKHLLLKRSGAQFVVEVVAGPLVSRHCPSVDVLFRSVAKYAGKNALGVIMTGMGDDGVRGLLEMKREGAQTLAQDEATCVVFGMPKEALKAGATDKAIPLPCIAEEIMSFYQQRS